MTSDQLRELYLSYFEEKGHTRLPSSSLVPRGDPTLLLSPAGMVQFKPYFLGEATPPNTRLTTCQKCFRTSDIDAVGDPKHLTFFEMLGNFSVGDYFKKEAIAFAWEFVTQRLKLPEERLWATVFTDDDEAYGYWREIGIPAERIRRLGEEDNFWGPPGDSGPCGPCSEINYDFGEEFGCGRPDCGPGCDCDRFLEVWNLVFTQYYQDLQGKRTTLAKKNIDTGMGLERMVAILQGKPSVYETDLFAPLIARVCELTGSTYGRDEATDKAVRIVAEHGRAVSFLIGDGILPSNEGRGYVLRRVLRRALLFGRKLGISGGLGEIAKVVAAGMGHVYPEMVERQAFILRVIALEEAKFAQTLSYGVSLLEDIVAGVKARGGRVIPGDEVFRLYDTYGFPMEVTREMAAEDGLTLDEAGFARAMEEQREKGRAAHRFVVGTPGEQAEVYRQLSLDATTFLGYETIAAPSVVAAILVDGQPVDKAERGQEVEVVLAETPFYGEMGGQVGDTGEIRGVRGRVVVIDTVRPLPEIVAHRGRVEEGDLAAGDSVEAVVDGERRKDIARNHTATHLLHAALRRLLGTHVRQAGSLVAPDRLRFDFTHLEALSREEILAIQRLVNDEIRRNLPVKVTLTSYSEAIAEGAIALFDEKYGDTVRVIAIPEKRHIEPTEGAPLFSAELCGGTHVSATGEIGICVVTSEAGIGAGMRRLEAITGRGAEQLVEERFALVESLVRRLQASPKDLEARVTALRDELESERKKSAALERQAARQAVEDLLSQVQSTDGVAVLAARVPASNMESMREMGDWLRDKLRSGVIVLGAVYNDKPNFLAMVTPDLTVKGIHAGDIVRKVAAVTGGGGGGRPEIAQAGGKDKAKLDEALRLVRELVRK